MSVNQWSTDQKDASWSPATHGLRNEIIVKSQKAQE
jgi:hypothetical protein